MAEISSSQQAYGKDGTYFTFLTSLDTNTGAFYTIMYDETGKIVTKGTPEEVISLLNKVKTDRTAVLADNSISTITSQKQSLTSQYQQQVPPPNTEPVPPPTNEQQTEQQNKQFVASGGANDETGGAANNNQTTSTSGDPSSTNTTPEIVITAKRPNSSRELPGKRPYNPLSKYSSYNYQLTLYMITPDAYDAFMMSDRKNINAFVQGDTTNSAQGTGGAFIVAQGGGLGTETPRPPGFDVDYYIDNLKLKAAVNPKATTTASNVTEMSFTITEPYGFSFISKLTKASEKLAQKSKLKNMPELRNATRNFFILGIRFFGYDKEGKLLTGTELADDKVTVQAGANFEFYYDIKIKSMKFKLNGKVCAYDITAASWAPGTALGTVRGRVNTGMEISGSTIEETLADLVKKLNSQQEELKQTDSGAGNKGVGIKDVYKIVYLGDGGEIQNIKEASTITDSDKKNKYVWPMSQITTTKQSNDGFSVKAAPDNTKRTFSFSKSISIMEAVNSVVSQSTFTADALKIIQKGEIENMAGPNANTPQKPPKKLGWYNLSSSVKVLGFDTVRGDFAYEITYYIQPYEIPYITSPYADKVMEYYGPHKRYEYWFTGQNSEILDYEQSFNNSYFMAALIPTGSDISQGGATDTPTQPMVQQAANKTGKLNADNEVVNSINTSLNDPSAYANAKITILGDPDFLVQESPSSINQVYRQFYGSNGYTINPNGGQVFIEIDFKESVDYSNETGLMSINESIQFWKYPQKLASIKGVSYMVKTIDSIFSGGKFTQHITAVIATFPETKQTANNESAAETARLARQNTATTGGAAARARTNFAATDPRRIDLGSSNVRTPTGETDAAPTTNSSQTNLGSGYKQDEKLTAKDTVPPDFTDLWYPTGETQNTTPTGGGPGINEPVAGGMPDYDLNPTNLFAVPTVNRTVANDDAVGLTNTITNLKKQEQAADGGRETENAAQENRNIA